MMRPTPTPRTAVPRGLGLGVAQFGNLFRETTDEDARDAVQTAFAGGVRYFDTAPHYGLGLAERRLGKLLAPLPRHEVIVSSKVGRLLVPSPETSHLSDTEGFLVPAVTRRQWDFSRDGILRSVDASLERTGLDRLDVLYLHDPEDHLAEASSTGIATLIELREAGVVGAVGVGTNFASTGVTLIERADIDVVMIAGRFTLLDQSALTGLLPLALERGVGVVAAGVYNSGLLSSPHPSSAAHFDYSAAPGELVARARAIAAICEAHHVSLPEAAIAFARRHPAVVSVVIGARNGAQMSSNLERYAAVVPDALFTDLQAAGILPGLALDSAFADSVSTHSASTEGPV
ncbi:aldo/keto reductase [Lacisediminihabitans sp. FW035]